MRRNLQAWQAIGRALRAPSAATLLAAMAGAIGVLGALAGCNSILGIDGARLEPEGGADGGSDAGTSTTMTDAGAAGDAAEPLTCSHYCDVVMQNCTGANQEYLTRDICMAMCPVFEVGGGIADSLDDTLGCRIWHANKAGDAPVIHCRHAGPLGGDHCGDKCEAFCNLDTSNCAGTNAVYDGGFAGCLSVCSPSNGYNYLVVDAGDLTQPMSNTLNCRLWHLESSYASPAAATIHCPHTALVSSMCHP